MTVRGWDGTASSFSPRRSSTVVNAKKPFRHAPRQTKTTNERLPFCLSPYNTMDDNHVDIEMKNFQTGDDFEDPEMLDGVFSKAARVAAGGGGGGGGPAGIGGPAEPGDWLRSRLRRQNRLVWIALVMLAIGSIAYVASGMYMSEEEVDALVETFESESGVVENGEKNGKYQTALDKANQNQSQGNNNNDGIGLVKTGSHWGNGHNNPYANHVNGGSNPRGNHNNKGGGGGDGFGGHNGLGKLGHKGGGHAGNFGNGGASGGQTPHDDNKKNNQGGVIDVDEAHYDPPPTQPPKSPRDVPPVDLPTVEVDEAAVFCEDLTQYQDWYDAKVTANDGTMYKVIQKLDHDKNAFT